MVEVEEDSFAVGDCLIDGKPANLYDFFKERSYDTKYPLLSDYSGAIINASVQRLDDENKKVIFWNPLFKGREYTTAKKFDNYADVFKAKLEEVLKYETNIIYNCNCVGNYFYGELDKHDIGITGAGSFGEIAYGLLNQTFTYLVIDEH